MPISTYPPLIHRQWIYTVDRLKYRVTKTIITSPTPSNSKSDVSSPVVGSAPGGIGVTVDVEIAPERVGNKGVTVAAGTVASGIVVDVAVAATLVGATVGTEVFVLVGVRVGVSVLVGVFVAVGVFV